MSIVDRLAERYKSIFPYKLKFDSASMSVALDTILEDFPELELLGVFGFDWVSVSPSIEGQNNAVIFFKDRIMCLGWRSFGLELELCTLEFIDDVRITDKRIHSLWCNNKQGNSHKNFIRRLLDMFDRTYRNKHAFEYLSGRYAMD